jgi:hypothetical protein
MLNDVCGKATIFVKKKTVPDCVVGPVGKDLPATEEIPVPCGSVMDRFHYHKMR